jgi:hypothetical protein
MLNTQLILEQNDKKYCDRYCGGSELGEFFVVNEFSGF